jgi:hypothetical protein
MGILAKQMSIKQACTRLRQRVGCSENLLKIHAGSGKKLAQFCRNAVDGQTEFREDLRRRS